MAPSFPAIRYSKVASVQTTVRRFVDQTAGQVGSQARDSLNVSQRERGSGAIVKRGQELRHPRSNRLETWLIVCAHWLAFETINYTQNIT